MRAFHSGWVYGVALYERCASAYNSAGNTRKQDRHSGEKKLSWNSTLYSSIHKREASVSPCGCSPVEVEIARQSQELIASDQTSANLYKEIRVNKTLSAFLTFIILGNEIDKSHFCKWRKIPGTWKSALILIHVLGHTQVSHSSATKSLILFSLTQPLSAPLISF